MEEGEERATGYGSSKRRDHRKENAVAGIPGAAIAGPVS